MGLPIASSFDQGSALPLDSRIVAANIAARDAIASGVRYQGLSVYVLDSDGAGTPANYQLQGGVLNTHWVSLGSSGSDTFTTVQVDGVSVSTNAPKLDFDGTDFTLTESPTDDFDITINNSGIDHDATTNFVANEHIDHTAITLTAGTGLTGGGDIAANRSFALSINPLTSVSAATGDELAIADVSDSNSIKKVTAQSVANLADHDALTNFVANEHIDHTSVSISAGTGLTGGGTIAATRTLSLSINPLTSVTAATGDEIAIADVSDTNNIKKVTASSIANLADHDALTNFVANEHIDHSAVSISAGTGLTGGGTIDATRTLSLSINPLTSVTAATGDEIAIADVSDLNNIKKVTAQGVANLADHDALINFVANEHIDHSAVSISAGTGLTGGGTIAANRTLSLSINPLTAVTLSGSDEIAIADVSDSNNIKKVTAQDIANLASDNDTFAIVQVDGVAVSTNAPTLDFDSTDFTLSESPTDDFDITINNSGIDHDATTNFVANEHIDHTSVTLTAGTGLTGGGTIAASRSFALSINPLTSVTAATGDEIAIADVSDLNNIKKVTASSIANLADHDALTNFVANEHVDHTSVSISAGTGLTGGGTIAANRTLSLDINSLTTVTPATGDFLPFADISNANAVSKAAISSIANLADHDVLTNFVANEHIDHSAVTLTAGEGLTGGGTIAASRSFALDFSDLSTTDTLVGGTDLISIHDGAQKKITFTNFTASIDHNTLTNFVANKHIDHTSVTLTAGEGLTGGGDISASRSFALDFSDLSTTDTLVGGTDLVSIHDGAQKKITFTNFTASIDHNTLTNFVANKHIDHTSVTLTAGEGLTGGGDISASRSFALDFSDLSTTDTAVLTTDLVSIHDGAQKKITFANFNASIDHDTTTNFVANEHIDHSAVSISAGTGLTGGGTIAANRTLSLSINPLTSVTAATGDEIAIADVSDLNNIKKVTASSIANLADHDALTNFVANEHIDHSAVSISAGTGLTGGGTIAANRTLSLSINPLTSVTAATGDEIAIADVSDLNNIKKVTASSIANLADHDALTNFVANEHIDHTSVTLTAGEGLSGGGDISASRSFALDFSDLSTTDTAVGATDLVSIHDGAQKKITFANFETSLNHDNLTGFVANEHIDWTSASSAFSTSSTVTASGYTLSGTSATGVLFANASGVFTTDTTNFVFDDTNNRLGIGISTPSTTLHVQSGSVTGAPAWDADDTVLIESVNDTTIQIFSPSTQFGGIGFSDESARSDGYMAYLHPTQNMIFGTAGSTRMTITSAGFVGIGTQSPVTDLTISSQSALDGSDPTAITIRSTRNSSAWTVGAHWGRLDFYSDDLSGLGAGVRARMAAAASNTSGGGTDLIFYTDAGGTLTECFRFNNNSYCQIGGSTAAALLAVNAISTLPVIFRTDAPASHANDQWQAFSNSTRQFTLDASGDVGIGSTQPVARLHVSSAGSYSSWTNAGCGLRFDAATYTNTSSSGTIASLVVHALSTPTLASSSVTTATDAATLYIAAQPTAGTNMTLTNRWAIWADAGDVRLDGALALNATSISGVQLAMNCASSTTVGIIVKAAASATADLQQWQNSSGSIITSVEADGTLFTDKNIGVGTVTFGTSADNVLALFNGTEPSTSPADTVQIFSVDVAGAGTAGLGLRTENAVATEAVVSDRTLQIKINGTVYKLCLKA